MAVHCRTLIMQLHEPHLEGVLQYVHNELLRYDFLHGLGADLNIGTP